MGVWPEDKEDRQLGRHFLVAQLCGVESLCLRAFSEQMGWEIEKIRKLCDEVTHSLRTVSLNPNSKGLGFTVKVVTARKPGGMDLNESDEETPTLEGLNGISVA